MKPDPILALIQSEAKRIAEQVYESKSLKTEFNVAEVPYHMHTGVDAPNVSYMNIVDRYLYIHHTLPGTTPQTSGNYSSFFIFPQRMYLLGVQEVHTTAGTGGTLQIQKLTGTTAPGSGTNMLSTTISLSATANTVQTGVLSTVLTDINVASGDRLCLVLSGTPTNLQNLTVVLKFGF